MPPERITQNTLFYGDNLPILRERFADERVVLMAWGLTGPIIWGMIIGQALTKAGL